MPDQQKLRIEDGQTMTEYGVVLGTLVLGVVAAIGLLGEAVASRIGSFVAGITGVGG